MAPSGPDQPLRILHAIHDFLPRHPAGSEIYAAELCRALAARGHYAAVLCAEFDPTRRHGQLTWRIHEDLPVVEIVNNWHFADFTDTYAAGSIDAALAHVLDIVQPRVVHVHNLLNLSFSLPALAHRRGAAVVATLHDHTLVCPSGGQRVHRAERHVCETIDPARCARCFPQSPFHAQMAVGRLARAPGGRLAGAAAAHLRRVMPRLVAPLGRVLGRAPAPGLDPDAIAARLDAARRAFAEFDIVVSPSHALAHAFAGLGFPTGRLVVSDYGFPPVPTYDSAGAPGTRLRVGFAGTLVWHKGPDLLIDAMRQLPQDRVEAVIFGDPGTFPDYAATLVDSAAGLPIRFAGRFSRGEIAHVFAGMDVLAVPSRWMENSPLVVHEAFLCGVPVVGARMGGIAELVEDGVNGFLFEPESPAGLASALRRILDEPALLDRFRAALPRVKSIDEDAREWEARYLEALASRRPGASSARESCRAEGAS